MITAGFDIASRSGICIMDGDKAVHVESWHAKVERPADLGRHEISVEYEAEIAEQFRDHARGILVAHGVVHVGFEEPRTRDFERKVKNRGGDWFGATETQRASSNLAMLRTFGLCRDLCGICHRLNIPATRVSPDDWRKAFLGFSRAPRGTKDGRKYLKQAVMNQCKLLRISVPNDDAGDSVGICFWLGGHLRIASMVRPGDLFAKDAAA